MTAASTRDGRIARVNRLGTIGRRTGATKFWRWWVSFMEARWLSSCGWVRIEGGHWGLPHWHPKLGAKPYDQSHAVNSQRYYDRKGGVVSPEPAVISPFVTFKCLARESTRQLVVAPIGFLAAGVMAGSKMMSAAWASSLSLVVGAIAYTLWSAKRCRRLMKVEQAERILANAPRRS